MKGSIVVVAALVAALGGHAYAQDLSPEEKRAKAQELNKLGAEAVAKQDWATALDKFQQAYGFFASPKVLLNIGAMLAELGQDVEAANVYQRYLDDPGSDSTKRTDVTTTLTKLDATLAVVAIKVTPADAELQLLGWHPGWLVASADSPWLPATQMARVRIAPGSFVVKARKPGWKPTDISGTASAGANRTVELTLTEESKVLVPDVVIAPPDPLDPLNPDDDLQDTLPVEAPAPPAMQLGALVDVAIDGKFEGFAVSPGISVRLANKAEVLVKAQIGGSKGVYLGGTYYFLDGKLRPQIGLGLPLFISDGVRVGVRGGLGICFEAAARISVVAEVGGEYFFNPEMDRLSFVVVPVIGVHARL